MKISVTKRELQSILSSHFRVNVTEVEMLDNSTELLALLKTKIGTSIAPSGKIRGIKDLIELSNQHAITFVVAPLGLAEAKYPIENWGNVLRFIELNGRYPRVDYQTGNMS